MNYYIELRGEDIQIASGDISADEGGYGWEGNFSLAKPGDYAKFKQNDLFLVKLEAETFYFVVVGKELNRAVGDDGSPDIALSIKATSPTNKFTSPFAVPQDYSWTTPIAAEAAALEVTDNEIIWDTVDWTIPAFRLAFSRSVPMDVVQALAKAAGAVVETTLDGELRVRPAFPTSVKDYETATPDHIFLESDSIFSVREHFAAGRVYNRYRIADAERSFQDNLEWIPDFTGAFTGVIRAYPQPWRTDVELLHTGDGTVSIGAVTVAHRQEEELVEVFQGQGNTKYPIFQLQNVEWEAINLGGILFLPDAKDVTVVGPAQNSLVRLTYLTRSLEYRISTNSGRPTQFLLQSFIDE